MHPHKLTSLGIGRTFQNIELFPGMTVLQNMPLARHSRSSYNFALACLYSPSVKTEEIRHHEILEEIIDFLEMQSIRKELVARCLMGCASGWNWAGHWPRSPACWCWTSLLRA